MNRDCNSLLAAVQVLALSVAVSIDLMCYLDPKQYVCTTKGCTTMVECCGCVAEMFGPGHDEAHIVCKEHA